MHPRRMGRAGLAASAGLAAATVSGACVLPSYSVSTGSGGGTASSSSGGTTSSGAQGGASTTGGAAGNGGMTTSTASIGSGGAGLGGMGGSGGGTTSGSGGTGLGGMGGSGGGSGGSDSGGGGSSGGELQWVLQFGGPADDHALSVAKAPGGAVVGGSFMGTAMFAVGFNPVAADMKADAFVLGVSSDEVVSAAKGFGSADGVASEQVITAVATNAAGEGCIAGYFTHGIKIGNNTLGVAAEVATDIFVAKRGAQGNILWAKAYGAGGSDAAYATAILPTGEVLVAGFVQQNVMFDGLSTAEKGASDAFVMKLDAVDGHAIWVSRFGGIGLDIAYGMAVDDKGGITVVGSYDSDMTFDNAPMLLVSGGGTDAFAAHFDSAGNAGWRVGWGDDKPQRALAVATDSTLLGAPLYVAGEFLGSMDFNGSALPATGKTLVPDVFVTRLLPDSGSAKWAKAFADTGAQEATEMGLAALQNGVVVTGSFVGKANFGPGEVSATDRDGFVVRLGENAVYQWSRFVGGVGEQKARSVAFGPTSEVYVAGDASGSPLFDGKAYLPVQGSDGFLMKLLP